MLCGGAEELETEFGGVPDLVAEEAVALHSEHVQVDVTTLGSVRTQGESQRVCATLGDAFGEVFFLKYERLKSAPYLRLKNNQGTTIGNIWIFFQKKFFLKKVAQCRKTQKEAI